MPEAKPSLQLELLELLLVGAGAVPGALLRWQLALHLGDQNLLVNVLPPSWASWPGSPPRHGGSCCWHWLLRFAHHLQQLDAGGHEAPQLRTIGAAAAGLDRADPRAGFGAAGLGRSRKAVNFGKKSRVDDP